MQMEVKDVQAFIELCQSLHVRNFKIERHGIGWEIEAYIGKRGNHEVFTGSRFHEVAEAVLKKAKRHKILSPVPPRRKV